ncbi:MAG: hypothetical protein JO291_01425, partial [Acidimicrobiia bacterium]|nr:hypothetical protein [Acidimicrobiia bacterium]
MRFRELVLSDASGGESLRLDLHPGLTVLSGLPEPARRELIETFITAAAGGRADRALTTDGPVARAWLDAFGGRGDDALVDELARLDGRLVALDEYDARVAYHQAATRFAAVDEELSRLTELEPTADDDDRILAAAEAIDALQERVASAVDRADRCRRVADWAGSVVDGSEPAPAPTEASSELVDLADRCRRARQKLARLERELSTHRADELSPGLDRRVALLAPLDQDRLWEAHRRVKDADAHLASAIERRSELEEDLPDEVEAAIDSAHIERVRAEEVVARRWRPGIFGSSVPAAVGLVLGLAEGAIGGVLVIVGIGVAARLIVTPRIALARASNAERRELARVGADSYLGLHLRRLADPTDPDAPHEMEEITHALEDAAREQTAALLAWKELVGRLDPSEADGLEAEIRVHAVRFNTSLRTETDEKLQADLRAAEADLAARNGRLADSARELTERAEVLDREAETAAIDLIARLTEQGIDPDQDTGAIAAAVDGLRGAATQRGRERSALRPRSEIEAEHAALTDELAERERPGWAGAPLPPPPPAGSSLLRRRRSEVVRRMAAMLPTSPEAGGPDLPLLLDEPLAGLAGDELTDALARTAASSRQVIYLTEDAGVATWARARSA